MKEKTAIKKWAEFIFPAIVLLYTAVTLGTQISRGIRPETIWYGIVLAAPIVFCSIIILYSIIKKKPGELTAPEDDDEENSVRQKTIRVAVYFGSLIILCAMLNYLGYMVGFFLYLFLLLKFLDKQSSLIRNTIISVVVVLFVNLVFSQWLSLRLPTGIFF